MIGFLVGKIRQSYPGTVMIETEAGIGFKVFVPDNSSIYSSTGENVKIYTSMRVKEDDISLYGFDNESDMALFDLLTTVNGIGPKVALSIMSTISTEEAVRAVRTGDRAMLMRASGVGKRGAERVILELKDKIENVPMLMAISKLATDEGEDMTESLRISNYVQTDAKRNAVDALVVLGYSVRQAENAVMGIADMELSEEEYIKLALKNM